MLHSLTAFSHFSCYPQSNQALLVLLPGWVHSRTLWVSPTNSPVKLGVSPTAHSTPTGIFNQWFEALFPCAGALGCVVCPRVHQLLPWMPHSTVQRLAGSTSCRLATILSTQLPVSAPPTSLDECIFFNSLVVRLPHSSIFCQFWLCFCF